jgi:hypothetical protein
VKEKELRELAVCKGCGKKLGASFKDNHTLPFFWKVTAERFMIDDGALRRQAGLEMMVGHVGIAQALSPDEDMAKQISSSTFCLCEHCAIESQQVLGILAMEEAPGEHT